MEIGEEDLPLAQHLPFGALGLLHLHDHVGGGENLRRRAGDGRPGGCILRVEKTDAETGARLDRDLVTVMNGLADGCRRHADAVFVNLDFLGNADSHDCLVREEGTGEKCSAAAPPLP